MKYKNYVLFPAVVLALSLLLTGLDPRHEGSGSRDVPVAATLGASTDKSPGMPDENADGTADAGEASAGEEEAEKAKAGTETGESKSAETEAGVSKAAGSEVTDSKVIGSGTADSKGVSGNSEAGAESQKSAGTVRIAAVGDIMLGRGVGMRLDNEGKGYIYPFEKVAGILKENDVIFGNLECPMTGRTECLDKNYKYVLKSEVKAIASIEYAGFNLLSLANNHILDYYEAGLFDTMDILKARGIAFSGAGKNLAEARKPAIIEKKGLKIALLSYTDMAEYIYKGNPSISFAAGEDKAGVAPRKAEYIFEDVEKIKDSVDILIVSLHWGIEESFIIAPEQIELAHTLIDMGVDVILGHHPHQFQGIEIYKGKPIAYSLGNFIFDQNDPENQEAFIVIMEFTGSELISMSALPVRTIGKTQVVPQSAEEAYGMMERQAGLSAKLGTTCRISGDRIVFDIEKDN